MQQDKNPKHSNKSTTKSRCCNGPVKVQNSSLLDCCCRSLIAVNKLLNWSSVVRKSRPKFLHNDARVIQKMITSGYCCQSFSHDCRTPLSSLQITQSWQFVLAVLILLYLTLSYFFCLFSYWDMAYDSDVMENRVGLNLLYAQVRGFIT